MFLSSERVVEVMPQRTPRLIVEPFRKRQRYAEENYWLGISATLLDVALSHLITVSAAQTSAVARS